MSEPDIAGENGGRMSTGHPDWLPFAQGQLDCVVCGESIPVVVMSRMIGDPGDVHLELTPDLNEVWVHWCAHAVTVSRAADEA